MSRLFVLWRGTHMSIRPSLRSAISLLVGTLLFLSISVVPLPAMAQEATPSGTPTAGSGLEGAVQWLVAQQQADGGFLGYSGESDPGATTDAVIALAAARNAGLDVDLNSALAYLDSTAIDYAQAGTGQAAKLALTMIAAGEDPRDVGGIDALSL